MRFVPALCAVGPDHAGQTFQLFSISERGSCGGPLALSMCHTLHYVGHWLVLDPTVNSSASAATKLAPDAQTTPVDHEHTQAVDTPPPPNTLLT
jgi:hypothetical protein